MEPPRRRPLGHARRWSRRLAMQAVYQWQMTGQGAEEIAQQFQEEANLAKADQDYFCALLYGVLSQVDELDRALAPHMDRAVDHVDPVERAVLRCACFELANRADVPYKVIINEAVELTKQFGSEQGHRFVNGVLDKLAPNLR